MEIETVTDEAAEDIVRAMLRDLAENEDAIGKRKDGDLFPPMLWLGDGRSIYVTEETVRLATRYARLCYDNGEHLKGVFAFEDFASIAHKAFANTLSDRDFEHAPDDHVEGVAGAVSEYIKTKLEKLRTEGPLEYCFGCSLVDEDSFKPFEIGPVRFETRQQWLDRKSDSPVGMVVGPDSRWKRISPNSGKTQISKVTKRRIEAIWAGKRVRKRKSSQDHSTEKDIIKTLDGFDYVATVRMMRMGPKIADIKSRYAIDAALAGVSLIWQRPARAAQGLHHSYGSRRADKRWIVASNETIAGGGSARSDFPSASRMSSRSFYEDMSDFDCELATVGKAIEWYIEPAAPYTNPKVLSIIAQALFWFGEACREEKDLKAIIGFAACIDILAAGANEKKRLAFLERLSGRTGDEKLFLDGVTLKEFHEQTFHSRNRAIHGPMHYENYVWGSQFTHDWSDTKERVATITRLCLLNCLRWVHDNPQVNDPKQIGETPQSDNNQA